MHIIIVTFLVVSLISSVVRLALMGIVALAAVTRK